MDELDGLKAAFKYNLYKFDRVLENSKEYLRRLGKKKRLKIVRAIIKNPNFDDTDIYYLCMHELQKSSNRSKGKRSTREKGNSLEKTASVMIPEDHTSKAETPVWREHKKPTKIRFMMKERPVSDNKHDHEGKGRLVSGASDLEKLKRSMTIQFTMKKKPRSDGQYDDEEKY
ncbi:Heterogeneous nuclear rnp K-like protein [Actinidia chinensis var. chinensis]|uniref:Heterogeneous nuclear rnp K-like protein n=1 Tax=Actinidia chinensis var. chinensis TaxID=1590841 RepID=A0A2R6PY90_ACTCC|nr:Heterogeneous nuclear rnp K-like protein [Actinidia chinensis var. chinensis]